MSINQTHNAAADLRLLSFNMQVGIGTRRYRDYVTRGWRNLLPSMQVRENMQRIAQMLVDYDIVGLQEIDAGSLRSGFENQIEWLCERAGFAYWHVQVNRNLGRFAQHGLGLISRVEPYEVTEHKLPGRVPGRGALMARFGDPQRPLVVVITHLALGQGSRSQQLAAIRELIEDYPCAVVMGDINTSARRLAADPALADGRLIVHSETLPTYPSWRPRRGLDHIMVSPRIDVLSAQTLGVQLSDHLPVAMEISLPETVAEGLTETQIVVP